MRGADGLADRFVWVFGWNLERDSEVPEIVRVLEAAGQHGGNGAVLSQKSPAFFSRLDQVQQARERNHLE